MLSDAPVAETRAAPPPESGQVPAANGGEKGGETGRGKGGGKVAHSHLAEILTSLARLADLQVAIWLASVKRLLLQIIFVCVLSILALLAVLVAVVFLYAGLFHILTDLLGVPTVWALLIFAGAHLALAGGFVLGTVTILNRKTMDSDAGEKKPVEKGGENKTGVAT